jgi:hypothetical protein
LIEEAGHWRTSWYFIQSRSLSLDGSVHSAQEAPHFLDWPGTNEFDFAGVAKNSELLPWLEMQGISNGLRDNKLEICRERDGFHLDLAYFETIPQSIQGSRGKSHH